MGKSCRTMTQLLTETNSAISFSKGQMHLDNKEQTIKIK